MTSGERTLGWNTRQYPYPRAPPFYGGKGKEFLEFERNILAGLAECSDEDSSLDLTLKGLDPGGDDPAAPPAGNAATQRRHAKRTRDLYLRDFVPSC